MSVTMRLIAGAMSGTSADGVDVAIVRVGGRGSGMTAELVRHHHRAYDGVLKRAIFSVRAGGAVSLSDLGRIGREISLTYAACVNEAIVGAGLTAGDLAAVAAHGQTLYHSPPDTIQWLDPSLLAAETGCAVLSDFRRADCAAGGQGAPLVPFADYILFRHPAKNRVLLNIGGIANLTYIPAGGAIDDLVAFDTGPGNCVSDWLCREREPGGPGYDSGGHIASSGQAHFATAALAARDSYVFRRPPKSTDGPAMIELYGRAKASASFTGSFADDLATACRVTAMCIKTSLDLVAENWGQSLDEILVSGGGVQNHQLMKCLREALVQGQRPTLVELEPKLSQAKEAMAFALLGAATLDGEPSNVPSCTGARQRVVLGSLTPRPRA